VSHAGFFRLPHKRPALPFSGAAGEVNCFAGAGLERIARPFAGDSVDLSGCHFFSFYFNGLEMVARKAQSSGTSFSGFSGVKGGPRENSFFRRFFEPRFEKPLSPKGL
jgi:hypothetical protein